MEKKITFTPHGVCSRQIEITLDGKRRHHREREVPRRMSRQHARRCRTGRWDARG